MAVRDTQQRRTIRRVFEQAGRPLSPAEVLAAARLEIRGLGIATVYRTINTLLEERWLVSVDLPGEAPRYERSGKDHHHHFHCRRCGRVYEIEGCGLAVDAAVPGGFRLEDHEVVLYGVCAACSDVKRNHTK